MHGSPCWCRSRGCAAPPDGCFACPRGRLRRLEKPLNARLQKVEKKVDARLRGWDREGFYLWSVAQRDFRTTYGSELVRLQPDIIHCHDPRMLPVAFAAAARIRKRTGAPCEVVYDSRENFAGIPEENISLRRYHDRLLRMERGLAPKTAAMLTVSEDTATALADRLPLRRRPVVVLTPRSRAPSPRASSARCVMTAASGQRRRSWSTRAPPPPSAASTP